MHRLNCESARDRLSDYLDDELGSSEREVVRAHLDACPECAETLAAYRRVVGRASALEDRLPGEDLWPGIARRIGARAPVAGTAPRRARRRLRGRWAPLLAAGVAAVVVAAGAVWLTGDLVRPPLAAGPGPEAGAARGAARTVGFADPGATRYDAAIADLVAAFDADRVSLDPETVRIVEENLAIIDRALARARGALVADPESDYLREHVERTKRQKLEVLQRVAVLASEL